MGKFHLCCWTFLQLLLVHFTTSQSLASCLPVLASTAWFLGSALSPNLCLHSPFSHSIFYVLQLHNTQPSVRSTLSPCPTVVRRGSLRPAQALPDSHPKEKDPSEPSILWCLSSLRSHSNLVSHLNCILWAGWGHWFLVALHVGWVTFIKHVGGQ